MRSLGLTLKWDKHIGHVSLKVSRVIDVFFRLKNMYPHEVLLTPEHINSFTFKLLYSGMGLQNSN